VARSASSMARASVRMARHARESVDAFGTAVSKGSSATVLGRVVRRPPRFVEDQRRAEPRVLAASSPAEVAERPDPLAALDDFRSWLILETAERRFAERKSASRYRQRRAATITSLYGITCVLEDECDDGLGWILSWMLFSAAL
jgi:hypothetical protein